MSLKVFHCHSLKWLCVIPSVLLSLTGWLCVVPGSHCCSLWWLSVTSSVPLSSLGSLCFIPGVPWQLTGLDPCNLWCLTAIHWVGLHGLRFTIATHWCGSKLFHVFHCHSIRWLWFNHVVPLLLIKLALCHPRCPKGSFWGGSASSQVFQCLFGVPHLFTG